MTPEERREWWHKYDRLMNLPKSPRGEMLRNIVNAPVPIVQPAEVTKDYETFSEQDAAYLRKMRITL